MLWFESVGELMLAVGSIKGRRRRSEREGEGELGKGLSGTTKYQDAARWAICAPCLPRWVGLYTPTGTAHGALHRHWPRHTDAHELRTPLSARPCHSALSPQETAGPGPGLRGPGASLIRLRSCDRARLGGAKNPAQGLFQWPRGDCPTLPESWLRRRLRLQTLEKD